MEQLPRHAPRLTVTGAQFRELASGPAGGALIGVLRKAQLNRTMLLLTWLVATDRVPREAALRLARAHDAAPHAVAPVLSHPWLGVWLAQCATGDPPQADRLSAAALAAAALAGHDLALPLDPRDGVIAVPCFGIRRAAGPVTLHTRELAGPGWHRPHRTRVSSARTTLELCVDDVDPFRDCFGVPVEPRLDAAAFSALARRLGAAWRLLAHHAPAHAAELAAGLSYYVPLADRGAGQHTITHSDAFGAFAASAGLSPVELAIAMVHEFQHSKLSALLGLVSLFDPADGGRYYSPWRADPRPVSGLLHGVYAFTAVAEVWALLRDDPALAGPAAERCATVAAQVRRGLAELTAVPSLTTAGRLWADHLAQRAAALPG